MHPSLNLNALLDHVLRSTQSVAEYQRAARADFSADQIEYKQRNDLVSFVDRESERRLVADLRKVLPGAGFILEEGDNEGEDREWRWIIDPLDGTTNFLHDIPAWCISIALQKAEETVLGVVHDVAHGRVYRAIKGQGAHVVGQRERLRVSASAQLEDALIGTGFPYAVNDSPNDYLSVLGELLKKSRGIRRLGAAALDLAWVAAGKLDAFYEMELQPWDVAAGALLVEEAGGAISDFGGTANFVFGRQIVASNRKLHGQLLGVLGNRF
ncbi:MAG: inositol monophosphatase family protein [Bacteroidota bacterium]